MENDYATFHHTLHTCAGAQVLRNLPFLRELPPAFLDSLLSRGTMLKFDRGQVPPWLLARSPGALLEHRAAPAQINKLLVVRKKCKAAQGCSSSGTMRNRSAA